MIAITKKARRQQGLAMVEAVVAMGVSIIALHGFYGAQQQAIQISRTGRAMASASQSLQERIEAFRYAPPWSNVTTAAGIRGVAASAPATASNFRYTSETFTVQAYPGAGSQLIVTRASDGTFTDNGVDLSTSSCVRLTTRITWTSRGTSNSQTRQVSTIIARGGL